MTLAAQLNQRIFWLHVDHQSLVTCPNILLILVAQPVVQLAFQKLIKVIQLLAVLRLLVSRIPSHRHVHLYVHLSSHPLVGSSGRGVLGKGRPLLAVITL